jgi:multidrug efflux pump
MAGMISHFFIDRPIFATVLSVLIALVGGIALVFLPIAQYPRITPPGVVVAISYPGANSQVVADTVAAPVEQQVNGVEGMLYMSSQMGNDGSYALTVTFDVGVDLNTALVMVQNRVALAMPQLPTQVQNQGITIRKKTPDILMIVNFFSPGNRYDDIYLSNYATLYVKDELLRLDGVSDVTYQGERDYSIRIWLDPQQLAARNMTAIDAANAIRAQNLDAPAGQIGQPPSVRGQAFQLPIDTLGRLTEPEQFSDIIVKVGQTRVVRPSGSGAPSPVSITGQTGGSLLQPSMTGGTGTSSTSSANMSTAQTSSSGAGTTSSMSSNSPSTGSTSSGQPAPGISTTGGGSTAGGSTSSGGGTTSGGGTSAGSSSTLLAPTAISISSSASTSTALSATSGGRGPGRPSASIVRLRDVARVELAAQNYNQSCTFDGKPSVGLAVFQLPGTNALEVADRVRGKMGELKSRFPDGLDYAIAYDTTPFIRESVSDVVITLFEAVALVSLVVLVFLQDWRAMVLPLLDVPVSIIGTFAVMAALGFSLNNISLFGLVLAIGIVVDDAIVVLENIERMMARGLDPRSATLKAMEEVTAPIVAVSLVLCAVFVPCAFISGITGQFFHQFAVTIAVSTVISAINAVTMTPSRAVLIFKAKGRRENPGPGPGQSPAADVLRSAQAATSSSHSYKEALPWWIFGVVGGLVSSWLTYKHLSGRPAQLAGAETPGQAFSWLSWALVGAGFLQGALVGGAMGWLVIGPVNTALGRLLQGFNHYFDLVSEAYGKIVGLSLRRVSLILVAYGGLLVLTYFMFQKVPTGFIPQQDQGRLIVNVQLPDSSSLERTQQAVARVDSIARATPGVAHTVALAGMSFLLQADSSNFASMFIVLDPFDRRQRPDLRDTAIMSKLRKAWAEQVKDAVVTVYGAAPIPGLGVAGGFKIMVEDRGGLGLSSLEKRTMELVEKLQAQPGLVGVATQFRANTPQLYLDIDRTKAAALGVSFDDLNQTLDMYLGSLYVNSYNQFGRHWQVTIQAEGSYRTRVEDINLFQVRNKSGQMVPLGTLVQAREVGGPVSVTRYNSYSAASISGNMQRLSTGDAIKTVNQIAAQTLPLSMRAEWTEIMFMQIRAGNTSLYIFLLSIISVFLALSALYENWSLPLAVILVVPLCLLFSLVGVWLTNRDVNIFVQIGLVVLVGLACKNAILVVEFAKQLHTEGRTIFDATCEASRLRLRPILMTSFAFIFGVIPLLVASGAGAEMRRSLGTAVFSGMLGVTLFGIFLTPVFFAVIQGLGETRFFTADATRRFGGSVLGGLLGAAVGFLLARLHLGHLPWGPVVGAFVGVLVVLSALEIHRMVRAGGNVRGP